MPNQFVARGGIFSSGSIIVTGSVSSSLGFFGTSSYADESFLSITSSFTVASTSSSFSTRAISSSHALISNTADSSSFSARTISGSHALASNNAISSSFSTRTISGSHTLASNTSISSSFSSRAISSSHALLANSSNSSTSASFSTRTISSSHALIANTADVTVSSSFATSAISSSYAISSTTADNTISASFSSAAISSSHALTANTADSVVSSSFATRTISSSHALAANTADISISSSFATRTISSSHALAANIADSSSFSSRTISGSHALASNSSISSSFATRTISGSHTLASNTSISSSFATRTISSSHALAANAANSAISSSFATRTISSSYAINSDTAVTASYALSAPGGSGLSGGTANYLPVWTSATAQSSSTIYQSTNNIGIGTNNPIAKLDVIGSIYQQGTGGVVGVISVGGATSYEINKSSNNSYLLLNDSSGTSKVRISSSGSSYFNATDGNVGIGTDNPLAKLDVVGGSIYQQGSGGILGSTGTGGNLTYLINKSSGHAFMSLYDSSVSENVHLDSSGSSWINGVSLGVGTTSPLAKFHVQGTSYFSGSATIQQPTSPTLTIQGNGGTGSITVGSDFRLGSVTNIATTFIQNNAIGWFIDTNKHYVPGANNSYDLGLTGTRIRTLWVTNISASNAIPTASFSTRTISGSHALNANTANSSISSSFATRAISSSHALTANTADSVSSASFATRSISSSHALFATSASYVNISSTVFAQTASYFSGSIQVQGLAEFPAGIIVTGSSILSGSVTSFGGLDLSGSSYFRHNSGSVVGFMKANAADNSVRFGAESFHVVNIDISGFTRYQYGYNNFLPTAADIDLGSTSNKWLTVHATTVSSSLFGTASFAASASRAVSASTAATASFLAGSVTSASYAATASYTNLPYASSSLSANVTLNLNSYIVGPSVSLSAGVWLVNGHITFGDSSGVQRKFFGRISDGTTHYSSAEHSMLANSNQPKNMALNAIVILSSTTTVGLYATTDSTSGTPVMRAAQSANGSGNNATMITAVKIA